MLDKAKKNQMSDKELVFILFKEELQAVPGQRVDSALRR